MPGDLSTIPISVHDLYAQNAEAFTKFAHDWSPISGERAALQTAIISSLPLLTSATVLLQTHLKKSWSSFLMPVAYLTRRSFSSYAVPFLGSNKMLTSTIDRIWGAIETEKKTLSPKEGAKMEETGKKLVRLCEVVKENNSWVDYATSHIREMLHA